MLKLNEEENMTFVFSTHDQRVISRARRVITLEDGKIVEQGTHRQLLDQNGYYTEMYNRQQEQEKEA